MTGMDSDAATVDRTEVATMNRRARGLAASLIGAAAVSALAACTLSNEAGTSAVASLALTPSPASLAGATGMPLPSGRYVTGGSFEPRIVLTIPEGWSTNDYGAGRASLVKPTGDGSSNAAFASFYIVSGVYEDPCSGGTANAAPADPEALVAALRSQPGFEIGPLSEGTLDGKPTWTWEVTPTVDISTCADDPWLYQWQYPGPTENSLLDTGTIAGAVQRLTVVDLDGTLLIAEVGTFEWTTEAEALEASNLVESASFD